MIGNCWLEYKEWLIIIYFGKVIMEINVQNFYKFKRKYIVRLRYIIFCYMFKVQDIFFYRSLFSYVYYLFIYNYQKMKISF